MAAVRFNHAPEIAGLHLELERTLVRIDDALDRGDRRAFRVWAGKAKFMSGRLATLLLKIATAKD
jgi:hypothetical protein